MDIPAMTVMSPDCGLFNTSTVTTLRTPPTTWAPFALNSLAEPIDSWQALHSLELIRASSAVSPVAYA
jgi:hypothetical protein